MVSDVSCNYTQRVIVACYVVNMCILKGVFSIPYWVVGYMYACIYLLKNRMKNTEICYSTYFFIIITQFEHIKCTDKNINQL